MTQGHWGKPENDIYEKGQTQLGIWDVATGKRKLWLIVPIGLPTGGLAFSRIGKTLGVLIVSYHDHKGGGFSRRKVLLLEVETGRQAIFEHVPAAPNRADCWIQFTPTEDRFVYYSNSDEVTVWDVKTWKELYRFGANAPGEENWFALSPDGQLLTTYAGRVFDFISGKARHTLGIAGVAAFSADSKRVAYGGTDGTVRLWDVATGKEVQPLTGPVGAVHHVQFSPDDQELISMRGWEGADLWNIISGKRSGGFDKSAGLLAFLPENRGYLANGPDQILRWRDAKFATRRQYGKATLNGKVSPNGQQLLSIPYGGDESILWDFESGSEVRRFPVRAATFSPRANRRSQFQGQFSCLGRIERPGNSSP